MNISVSENKNSLAELNGRPLRLLIGGSPCTYWSISQKSNRETVAEGIGWELFKNYLIAKEKFKPDYFLYENNKSASQNIKNQISIELGVELQYINSALVSAQNRQRFYAHNIPNVEQPEDRGILLKDIIEKHTEEKTYVLDPICVAQRGRYNDTGKVKQHYEPRNDGKTNTITTVCKDNMIAEPIRIGTIKNNAKTQSFDSKQYRVYSPEGKSTTICGQGGGVGAKTGLYLIPESFGEDIIIDDDGNITTRDKFIYCVNDGSITDNGYMYNIKLPDGYYSIRKLTPVECERLQTLPDGYTAMGVDINGKEVKMSANKRYRGIGNGWTAEVIIYILSHINIPKDYPIEVLSMYDGIGTGMYCLKQLGYTNIIYKAYEIDESAISITRKNYPEIIQCGDAFQVRDTDWKY